MRWPLVAVFFWIGIASTCGTVDHRASARQLANELLDCTGKRASNGSPVPHMVNMRSSGFHWLEWLIANATQVGLAKEVYIPLPLRVLSPSTGLRKRIVETVVLLHSERYAEDLVNCPLVHSGHSFSLSPEPGLDERFQRILLVRDPVDIVMFRIFRKPVFREQFAPKLGDRAYLDQNIWLVKQFFRRALSRPFIMMLQYQQTIREPKQVLSRVCDALKGLWRRLESPRQFVKRCRVELVRGDSQWLHSVG